MNVLLEDVTDLYGFEFEVSFDPTLLEVVDANPSVEGVQVGAGGFLSPDWVLENTVDNEEGTIAYAVSQRSPSESISGDGVLAVITWRSRAVGTSPVVLTHVLLAAPQGAAIPARAEDGQVEVVSLAAEPADTPLPTETFTPLPTTSKPTSTPMPPTVTLAPTSIPSTPTQPATALPDTAEPPAATSSHTPLGASKSTTEPAPSSTSPATPTQAGVSRATTPAGTSTVQPQPLVEDESLRGDVPTSVSSSGPSGSSSSILIYVALACLVAGAGAIAAALLLRRGQ